MLFPDISTGVLFSKRCTQRGWLIPEMFSEEDLTNLKNRYKGNSNHNSDKTEYEFINVYTLEKLAGTRHDLMGRVEGFNASSVVNGVVKVSKGWTLVDVFNSAPLDMLRSPTTLCNNPKADKTEYTFINLKTRDTFSGTRTQFQKRFGFSLADLFDKDTNYSVKEWCLLSRLAEAELKAQRDYKTYEFAHKDGGVFVGTRVEFKCKFGFSIKPLFGRSKLKTCKGWSLAPKETQ